jgi:hypothetical protein
MEGSMADIWEQAVEIYLAMDRGLFLNPQYLIGTPGVWEANPDFLALEFPDRRAWMVEVTKAPRLSLFNKIRAFEGDYVRRIKEQLEKHKVILSKSPADEWAIGLWVFAPEKTLADLKSRMRDVGVKTSEVTALEDTLAPSAWDSRFR